MGKQILINAFISMSKQLVMEHTTGKTSPSDVTPEEIMEFFNYGDDDMKLLQIVSDICYEYNVDWDSNEGKRFHEWVKSFVRGEFRLF